MNFTDFLNEDVTDRENLDQDIIDEEDELDEDDLDLDGLTEEDELDEDFDELDEDESLDGQEDALDDIDDTDLDNVTNDLDIKSESRRMTKADKMIVEALTLLGTRAKAANRSARSQSRRSASRRR